ncbi:MAG: hypothetical protein GAK31_02320 [Stenotrophomonas maltophilia]|uniref:DUF2242 domain-containing protein n=1 Tax=Stenotrophomonas maltophilia TaxID=40324 RepID=A0A7V8FG07_STEMA|nr:MAG: hypothetical protein GAK31_02320 [Stenotrophomonas maltophilia]
MRTRILITTALLPLVLAGCGGRAADSTVLRETFDSGDTFSRTVDGKPAEACEAARRTLLSQGYAVARADDSTVEGNKNFQPRDDEHEQLVLRISCAPRGSQALVFVSAVQDRYALKKSPTSASVGVGAIGSVSLPFGSNDDSLVKVASSTVVDAAFYKRFFERLQQYLPAAAAAPAPTPAPTPAPPTAAPASVPASTLPAPEPVQEPAQAPTATSPAAGQG